MIFDHVVNDFIKKKKKKKKLELKFEISLN